MFQQMIGESMLKRQRVEHARLPPVGFDEKSAFGSFHHEFLVAALMHLLQTLGQLHLPQVIVLANHIGEFLARTQLLRHSPQISRGPTPQPYDVLRTFLEPTCPCNSSSLLHTRLNLR